MKVELMRIWKYFVLVKIRSPTGWSYEHGCLHLSHFMLLVYTNYYTFFFVPDVTGSQDTDAHSCLQSTTLFTSAVWLMENVLD